MFDRTRPRAGAAQPYKSAGGHHGVSRGQILRNSRTDERDGDPIPDNPHHTDPTSDCPETFESEQVDAEVARVADCQTLEAFVETDIADWIEVT